MHEDQGAGTGATGAGAGPFTPLSTDPDPRWPDTSSRIAPIMNSAPDRRRAGSASRALAVPGDLIQSSRRLRFDIHQEHGRNVPSRTAQLLLGGSASTQANADPHSESHSTLVTNGDARDHWPSPRRYRRCRTVHRRRRRQPRVSVSYCRRQHHRQQLHADLVQLQSGWPLGVFDELAFEFVSSRRGTPHSKRWP